MTTVNVRIERLDSGDRLYLPNGMWGRATNVLARSSAGGGVPMFFVKPVGRLAWSGSGGVGQAGGSAGVAGWLAGRAGRCGAWRG